MTSPSKIDYKERADFWQDYLKNHSEAKWRKRNNQPSGFPFLERELVHPFTHFIRYHHYMGLLTGEPGYGEYAVKMFNKLQEYTQEISTPNGPALVWQHQLLTTARACQPTLYARSTLGAIQDLNRAGFAPFSDKMLVKYARTLSEIINFNDLTLQKNVCGEQSRGVIVSNPRIGEFAVPASAISAAVYSISPYSGLAKWDKSKKIEKFSLLVYQRTEEDQEHPKQIIIPAAMFLAKK